MSQRQKNILDHFDELAEEYDQFKNAIPNYRDMVEVMREAFDIWAARKQPDVIAELGTGTGELARAVVDTYEPDTFVAIDGSEKMIERTEEQFADFSGSTSVHFREVDFSRWEPTRTFDWVYSSLSVHHLLNPGKERLFRKVYDSIKDEGYFLLCDIFRRRETLLDFYRSIKHRRLLDRGFSDEEAREHWESHVPNRTLSDWENFYSRLEEIGFVNVECLWRNMYRAIFVATK